MYKYSVFIFFIYSLGFSQTTKKVCFVGNSYTYVNDMPQLISDLATADGNTLIKDQNTPGGYTLEGHSTHPTTLSKIAANDWDYVVLQDQSQLPSFPWSQVQTDVFPYAAVLVDSIRAANECAIPLFYNTWGRRDGDSQWDSINTFDKMNQRLHTAYGFMANLHSGKRAPIGIAFNHVDDDTAPPITHFDLYSTDGSHPSIYGSYLAACIFYEIIFDESCVGNSYYPGSISTANAAYLQTVANHVVHDVDSVEIDFTQPLANFSFVNNGNEFTFTNESEHAFSWEWDFGDGNNSTDLHPVHTYATAGSYDVTLTAIYCNQMDDTTFQVSTTAGWKEESIQLIVYPNPTSGSFTVSYQGLEQKINLYSLDGRFIDEIERNKPYVERLESGIYIIQAGNSQRRIVVQ